MKKLFYYIIILLLISYIQLFSLGNEKKIDYSIDIMGIGGAGIGANDKLGMVFLNPAASALPIKRVIKKIDITTKTETLPSPTTKSETKTEEKKENLSDEEYLDNLVQEAKEHKNEYIQNKNLNQSESLISKYITNEYYYWKVPILSFGTTFNGLDSLNIVFRIMENFDLIYQDPSMLLGILPLDELLRVKLALGLSGPIKIGFVGFGFTALFYDNINLITGLIPALPIPNLEFSTIEEIGFRLGYAMKIPFPNSIKQYLWKFQNIYAGIQMYYLQRLKMEVNNVSIIEFVDNVLASFQTTNSSIYSSSTIGFDFGLISKAYDIGYGDLTVGLVFRDISPGFYWRQVIFSSNFNINNIFSPSTEVVTNTYFGFAVDTGCSYSLNLEKIFPNFQKLPEWLIFTTIFYFDIRNIFDFSENFFLKLRMGVEFIAINILKLRLGLYKGYPTIGLGLEIPGFKINGVYFVEENGTFPGALPQQNIMFEMSIAIP